MIDDRISKYCDYENKLITSYDNFNYHVPQSNNLCTIKTKDIKPFLCTQKLLFIWDIY